MFDIFLAEILILFLLLAVELRIFFTKTTRIDSIVAVAPISFIISLITIFICGAEIFILLAAAVSLLVFLTNIRSLFRLSAQLFIDRYSTPFILTTVIEAVLTIIILGAVIFFRPVKYNPEDFDVIRTRQFFSGTTATGIIPEENLFNMKKKSGLLYTYSGRNSTENNEDIIIIFAGCRTAEIRQYEPYLLFLAQKGFTVLAADFYTNYYGLTSDLRENSSFRRFFSIIDGLNTEKKELSDSELNRQRIAYISIGNLALKKYGTDKKLFFVTDGIDSDSITAVVSNFNENSAGFFSLTGINEYKTPLYGFTEQTDVLLAYMNGQRRDSTFFIPRYAAIKTLQTIELYMPSENIQEIDTEEPVQE